MYFKLLEGGIPKKWIEAVMESDGWPASSYVILDNDPNKPLSAAVKLLRLNGQELDGTGGNYADALVCVGGADITLDSAEMTARTDPEKAIVNVNAEAQRLESANDECVAGVDEKNDKSGNNAAPECFLADRSCGARHPELEEKKLEDGVGAPIKAAPSSDFVANCKNDSTVKEKDAPDKNAALKALFAKRASASGTGAFEVKENDARNKNEALKAMRGERSPATGGKASEVNEQEKDAPDKNTALKTLFAKRASESGGGALEVKETENSCRTTDAVTPGAGQIIPLEKNEDSGLPLREEYSKYFKMLKIGVPNGAVRQELQKDGLDPNILDMDPEKSYASQVGAKEDSGEESDPPLKDDPEYMEFFKMLRIGLPCGAVQQALTKAGKDPSVLSMDPDKSYSSQIPKLSRKRVYWQKIDESMLGHGSFWESSGGSPTELRGLDVDNEQFQSLFTSPTASAKTLPALKPQSKQKETLIDSQRGMIGSVLLAKLKVQYKTFSLQVENMEATELEGDQLRDLMKFLPQKDEVLAIQNYLPPHGASQAEINVSLSKLGECEQFMAAMLNVPRAEEKMQFMVIRAEFGSCVDNIERDLNLLNEGCDRVKRSARFKKLLQYALKLGNAMNTGSANEEAKAITIESLLKLAEARAYDKRTSVLKYLICIVQKNDEDLLKLPDEFGPLNALKGISVAAHSEKIKSLSNRLVSNDKGNTREWRGGGVQTDMGKFASEASDRLPTLSSQLNQTKKKFASLLDFFGENSALPSDVFFGTVCTFASLFDDTHKQLVREQKAKVPLNTA
ncbi:LOW QUALITY PROTEIN: hypothetical protein ACHAXR_005729 [Thalassiosira sp. AJA248-18]